MNKNNLDIIFNNYLEHFDYFNDLNGGNEIYKWYVMASVRDNWNLESEDLSQMIKQAFSKTYNLVNNRIVSPGNGLSLAAREEPEAVRRALAYLLEDIEDTDEKQERIYTFVDDINAILEKHFSGKWKYTQDMRVAITYLALIKPDDNFLYKSTPAHSFARYAGYDTDIGYGEAFKLKHYYRMCEEIIDYIRECPQILEKVKSRNGIWPDRNYHLLATDLIYCFGAYPFMHEGLNEVTPRTKKGNTTRGRQLELEARAAEIQEKLDGIQEQIDNAEHEIEELPLINLQGKKIKTRAYGEVTITKQESAYLTFSAEGKEREFVLPDCVSQGFLIPDDPQILERCKRETDLQDSIRRLNMEQQVLMLEMRKY